MIVLLHLIPIYFVSLLDKHVFISCYFCRKLTYLFLQDLPEVRNRTKCYSLLREALPNCNVDYKDLAHSPT